MTTADRPDVTPEGQRPPRARRRSRRAPATTTPLLDIIKRAALLVSAGAVATISATLVPDRLLPENVSVIGRAGSLIVLIALLTAWAVQARLRARLLPIALATVAALAAWVVLHALYVVPVAVYGDPPAEHHYLLGARLSEQGRRWCEQVGNGSTAECIRNVGHDRIADMYGSSYSLVATLYTLGYIALLFGIVLLLAAATLGRRRAGAAAGA